VRVLPLYDDLPRTPVEESERLKRDPGCTRCELHRGVKTVCVPPAGQPGGLLVVGEGPGRSEDLSGQPFIGRSGQYLRERLKRHWPGPVAVHNSTSCYPGRTAERAEVAVDVRHVDACRPYLAHVLAEARPKRVVCVGAHAARAVTGRAVPPTKTRRGYAYLFWTRLRDALRELAEAAVVSGDQFEAEQLFVRAGEVERDRKCAPADWHVALEAAAPVFFLLHPAAALRNRFVRQAFEEDLEWALTCPDPPKPPVTATFAVVESAEDDALAARQLRRGLTAFDVEAGGVTYTPSYRVVSLAAAPVSAEGKPRVAPKAYVWPTGAPDAELAAWLADPKYQKTGANVQYDINAERQRGRAVRGVTSDVRLRRKLLEPHASGALDDMADLVGMGGYKKPSEVVADRVALRILNGLKEERLRAKHVEEVARGKYKKPPKRPPEKQPELEAWQAFREADPEMAAVVAADPSWGARWGWVYAAMARLEPETLWRYNAKDAVVTAVLDPLVAQRLAEVPALDRVRSMVVDHLPEVVAQVEAWGVQANEAAVRAFDAYLVSRVAPIEQRLASYDSVENWKSVPQKARLLYDELGLKSTKKTRGGAKSVDASSLKALKGQHPIIDDLLEHSRYTDLRKTFACGSDGVSGMLQYIRPDGRMHPSILMDGAATGRPSARDPNLFNIPAKKFPVEGRMARDAVCVAPAGSLIVSVDFSQIELRVAAHLSGDERMIALFRSGVDFHMRTAQTIAPKVWGIKPEEVHDSPHRAHAKNFIFGLLYGMGDRALATRMFDTQAPTDDQIAQAKKIRHAILGEYVQLAAWIEKSLRVARETGFCWTEIDGEPARRRDIWDIGDADEGRRGHAEREAINSPIQGGAADFLNRSLIAVVRWILSAQLSHAVKVLLPIYDQLLMEVRRDLVDEVCEVVPAVMTSWPCSVPIVADVEVGRAWGSLRKMKVGPGGWRCHARGELYSAEHPSALVAFDEAERLASA
jgi:uracil-DNA glycosylase family 4